MNLAHHVILALLFAAIGLLRRELPQCLRVPDSQRLEPLLAAVALSRLSGHNSYIR